MLKQLLLILLTSILITHEIIIFFYAICYEHKVKWKYSDFLNNQKRGGINCINKWKKQER